jgi:DNA-binding IclR family transcriptional regulator
MPADIRRQPSRVLVELCVEWASMSVTKRQQGQVQSVDRAISLLEFLSRNGLTGVTELAAWLDIHKSTAYRLIATLEARGLVEQDIETEKYQLGYGLVSLASAVTADFDIVRRARAVCQRLSDETNETVTVTILEGDDPVVLDQASSSRSVLSADRTRSDAPIHCTAAGKVFLAFMSERRRHRILSRPLERFTEHTLVDRNALCAQLDIIRITGYAYTIEELELGLNAVGAPVFAIDGKVAAVITLSSPAVRLPDEIIPTVGQRVKQAAAEISRKIGFDTELHAAAG